MKIFILFTSSLNGLVNCNNLRKRIVVEYDRCNESKILVIWEPGNQPDDGSFDHEPTGEEIREAVSEKFEDIPDNCDLRVYLALHEGTCRDLRAWQKEVIIGICGRNHAFIDKTYSHTPDDKMCCYFRQAMQQEESDLKALESYFSEIWKHLMQLLVDLFPYWLTNDSITDERRRELFCRLISGDLEQINASLYSPLSGCDEATCIRRAVGCLLAQYENGQVLVSDDSYTRIKESALHLIHADISTPD